MLAKKAIIFDFDYTLADSSDAIVECFNYSFKTCNLPCVPPEKVYPLIGLSLPESFRILNGVTDVNQVDELRRHFRLRGDQIALQMTYLFDATPIVIKELKACGYRLGIVSTKYSHRISAVLKRDMLEDVFEEVVGGNDVEKHKPDPEGIEIVLKRMSVQCNEALYVGDSVTDAEAAQSAGVDFIAVLTGVTKKESLQQYNPIYIANDLDDLKSIILEK